MDKENFVDNSLIQLRHSFQGPKPSPEPVVDAIAAPTPTIPEDKAATKEDDQASSRPSPQGEYLAALKQRRKEFRKTREEMDKGIGGLVDELNDKAREADELLMYYRGVVAKLSSARDEIRAIDESEWDKKDFATPLASATRKVENARLEYVSAKRKLGDSLTDSANAMGGARHLGVPELLSVSGWQWFRVGFFFFFPLVIGLLLSCGLLALAILAALGAI